MIQYIDSAEGVTPPMLRGFFEGWKKPRTAEEHLEILKNSAHIVLAVDTESGRVVGFITALSDGAQAAFIPLLEVLPEHRRRGIGTELVARLLRKLEGIQCIDVMCDPDVQKFYAKFRMRKSVGMILRNY